MKKGLISKVATTGLAMGLLMSGGLFATNASAAGNYRDTPFKFSYTTDGSDVFTEKRAKQDYTSSYAYSSSTSNAAFVVTIHGSNDLTSKIGADCTYGTPRSVGKGESKYLPNLVKERGYSQAQLGLMPLKSGYIFLQGEWSPDSI